MNKITKIIAWSVGIMFCMCLAMMLICNQIVVNNAEGKVLLGVKQACNQAFREMMPVELVAMAQIHAQQKRENGLLFAKGFNDKILLRDGQLERWLNYLKDNPRRLLMKRENPELFRVQRGLVYAGQTFSAIGNRFLLERPLKQQVQCSRNITETDLQTKLDACLQAARQGAVLVSPAISKGEKAIKCDGGTGPNVSPC